MANDFQRQPRLWPVVLVTALLLGATLWALWMFNLVKKTRATRGRPPEMFIPMTGATNQPAASGTNGMKTNQPGGTNLQ